MTALEVADALAEAYHTLARREDDLTYEFSDAGGTALWHVAEAIRGVLDHLLRHTYVNLTGKEVWSQWCLDSGLTPSEAIAKIGDEIAAGLHRP